MRVGIMQPYFFPYLGYFQLVNAVDKFIIYDNIEYTKKGWINRNRYLCDGIVKIFTIPIAKNSDYMMISQRMVADNFNRRKIKKQIETAYKKAPYFDHIYPLFCECIDCLHKNLFEYVYYSFMKLIDYLGIETEIIISSTIPIDHKLKGKEKVLEICKYMSAQTYINAIGGIDLYDLEEFKNNYIDLKFIRMNDDLQYRQFRDEFVEGLSILDVLMFNSKSVVRKMLDEYSLITE